MKNFVLFLIMILLSCRSSYADRYYVDPDSGSDGNSGLSPEAAWKTLDNINVPPNSFKTKVGQE